MKYFYSFLLLASVSSFAQETYYDSIEFDGLTGQNLYFTLAQLIDNASDTYTYGDIRADFEEMELDPDDATESNILLTYGHLNTLACTSGQTDRRIRSKSAFGGGICQFNREHVFARSNAVPGMGDTNNNFTGIVADPQNLRATDVQRNGLRGSRKFASGSGKSGNAGANWYPGDEWKGDVARIMMYMYTRYGDRCLPEYNAVGNKEGSTEMLQILLQWNVDDPVSAIEDNRNDFLEVEYLNRNPFIDNPALATVIWGGPDAEDRWGNLLTTEEFQQQEIKIFPNPANGNEVNIISNKDIIAEIYDILGKRFNQQNLNSYQRKLNISGLKKGVYLLKLKTYSGTVTKKLIRQ